ncbi:hypothetical protein Pmar_PMAR025338 [Perkinsus marinus ATCC 50983]|uniref:Uncharacterized protein n=1 Tax=Perkinsus marinus (strain ATCC 50983 / TXsc) TaxID=423536 RepID=C5KS14_PERM5|nr:hypothetical protein Pmar_PMAR025338 [Perkinsus marinus ATCC 50983]EER12705.1 hypothetical protein Pmar_PMAR025338 [Perkinsus marinus ATCC 50983]|eukprot:XP_002780910.1 hypothetical protein Pmar_PMAR025338 [Perkinsus marinus ATCC 50983]
MVNVQEAMQLIEEYDNLRQKMSADTAESAQTVHNKRRNNHGMLLDALRGLNLLINRGASLRVGRAQAAVIAECKKAIKNKNAATLVGVISQGGYLGPLA